MKAQRLLPWLLVLATACPLGQTPKDDTGFDTAEADVDTDTDTDSWPSGDPDFSWPDDLSSGTTVDLNWADLSSVACWPGTENSNFNGHHVFFELTQAADQALHVRVTPDNGVDVSLYAMEFNGNVQAPPDVTACVSCEASADWTNDANPGQTEEVFLSGFNPYEVLIGVAGADHTDTGGFTLEVWANESDW